MKERKMQRLITFRAAFKLHVLFLHPFAAHVQNKRRTKREATETFCKPNEGNGVTINIHHENEACLQ